MKWNAKLQEPQLIRITQDRTAAGVNDKVSYNFRCQKPLVDFDVNDVGRLTIDVKLPYAGDYTVTRRIQNGTTRFTKTSATFVNKDIAPIIEIVGVEDPDGEPVAPKKKTPRKKKAANK